MTAHVHFLPFESLPVFPRGNGIVNYVIANGKVGARAIRTGISVLPVGVPAPRHAAFAVATSVGADRVAFTNSHWDFSCSAVQAALGLQNLLVLNDFESLALSLPGLRPEQVIARRDL